MCYTVQGLARAPHRYPVRTRPVRARKAVVTHHRSFIRRAAGVQSFIVAANREPSLAKHSRGPSGSKPLSSPDSLDVLRVRKMAQCGARCFEMKPMED
eukprot:scaffold12793_cov125-Isochrysis_galbana.AAC.1